MCPKSQLVHDPILERLLVSKNMSFNTLFDQSGSLFRNFKKKVFPMLSNNWVRCLFEL